MKTLIRYLLILITLGLDTGAANADGSSLCVRSIPIQTRKDGPAKAAGTIVSRPNQTIAPSAVDLPALGQFPLIYDAFTEQLSDGKLRNRTFFWLFTPNGELLGPYDLDDRQIRSKVSVNSIGMSAADANGRILFLVGSYDETGSGPLRYQPIYHQDWGQRPLPFRPDLQETLGEPGAIFWSDLQHAFLVQSRGTDSGTGDVTFKTNVIKGQSVKVLAGYDLDFAADLPTLGVTALLGFSRLAFLDRTGVPTSLGAIKSGSEGDNWTGIYETRDPGWLYIDGDEYDHAVQVERTDSAWRMVSLIRLVNDEGILDRYKDESRMEMEGLSDIVRTGPCRTFSTAIQRMISCSGPMRELRAGALVPIGSAKERLMRFVGDADSLGLALFQTSDGRLYGYDGEHLTLASGTLRDRALVQNLPSSRRTFLSTQDSLFELRREGEHLHLEQLSVPSHQDLLFTRFFEISGHVMALLREGVYAVDEHSLRAVWVPDAPEQIDTTGPLGPNYVPRLSGVLFSSTQPGSGVPQLRLLSNCLSWSREMGQ
jgi:hypothetical protein